MKLLERKFKFNIIRFDRWIIWFLKLKSIQIQSIYLSIKTTFHPTDKKKIFIFAEDISYTLKTKYKQRKNDN